MTAHRETIRVVGRRLGRRPPKNAPALQLGRLLTGVVPSHPTQVDWLRGFQTWDMLGNDRYGDCGPVSVANYLRVVTKTLTGNEFYANLADVLDLYKRSGNPDFPNQDDGVDMQTMLEELARNGIAGRKCVAFAKVDVANVDEARAAIDLFGGLLLGVDLKIAQQSQTDHGGPWDYVHGSGEWGGHAVVAGAYTSAENNFDPDIGIETWAELLAMTDRFWDLQVQEAWVVIWPEHLQMHGFDEAVDLIKLADDYTALTGRVLPLPPPQPAPTPPPVPDPTPTPPKPDLDPDEKLNAVTHDWAFNHHHHGPAKRVADALREWVAEKGL